MTLVEEGPEHSKRRESMREAYVIQVLSTIIRRYDLVSTGRVVNVVLGSCET